MMYNKTIVQIQSMSESLENVIKELDNLEQLIGTLIQNESIERINSPQNYEDAKFCTSLAFVLSSLYYVTLRLEGTDPKKHAIMDEIERIKEVVRVLNGSAEKMVPSKKTKLDLDAAQRMIVHNL